MRVNQVEQVVCLRDSSSTFVLQRLMKVSKSSIRGLQFDISTTSSLVTVFFKLSFQLEMIILILLSELSNNKFVHGF
jgi:hypothetical protein